MNKSLKISAALAVAAALFVASPLAANAAEFGDGYAFGGHASPALPSCTEDGVYQSFTFSNMSNPYSDATGGNEALGSNTLRLVKGTDPYYPYALELIGSDGKPLRYDAFTSTWVNGSDPAYKSAARWSSAGRVYGLSSEGRVYVSYETDEPVFLSESSHSNGDSVTYTPSDSLNECVEQAALVKGQLPGLASTSGSGGAKHGSGSGSGSNSGSGSTTTGSTTTASTAAAGDGLAHTGIDQSTLVGLLGVGVAAVAGGGLLLARRRRSIK